MLKGFYKYTNIIIFYGICILNRNAKLNGENEVLRNQIEELKKTLDKIRTQDAKRFVQVCVHICIYVFIKYTY